MSNTKLYADMTVNRLRRRALQALDSIVEDAQRAKKDLEDGHRPTLVRTISSNAETVVEACGALEILHEVQKLENAS